MRVLITGSQGFIGSNLIAKLSNSGITDITKFNKNDPPELLHRAIPNCDIVIHLAAVMRPDDKSLFKTVNEDLTKTIANLVSEHHKKMIFSSSIMAELDTDYGKSKKAGEAMLLDLGNQGIIFRLANVFGPNASPDTVVPTFCRNISRHQPITILENREIQFINIDDVTDAFTAAIQNFSQFSGKINYIQPSYETTILRLAEDIFDIKKGIQKNSNQFYNLLKETYENYAP